MNTIWYQIPSSVVQAYSALLGVCFYVFKGYFDRVHVPLYLGTGDGNACVNTLITGLHFSKHLSLCGVVADCLPSEAPKGYLGLESPQCACVAK